MEGFEKELAKLDEEYEVCSNLADTETNDDLSIKYREEAGKCMDRKIKIKQMEQDKELAIYKEKNANKRSVLDICKEVLKVGIPAAITLGIAYLNRDTLFKQTEDICNFEKTNTFTSSAGRHLSRNSFTGKY